VKDLHRLNTESRPFVAFSFPNEDKVQVFIDSGELGKQEGSFVFAPFTSDKHNTLCVCPTETHFFSREEFTSPGSGSLSLVELDKSNYEDKIRTVVEKLQTTELDKVVLSRQVGVHFSGAKSDSFKKSLSLYPSAFVYWFFHPESGHWQGATPELFLSAKGLEIETSSLAGTRIYAPENKEKIWGEKERKEQQFVTDFIIDQLKDLTENISQEGPKNHIAGNLVHLKTKIRGILKSGIPVERVISALHPTPAVCGTPRELALQTIKDLEDYDRQYYTGYLGLKNDKKTQLYVNLRCMKLFENSATIFVGGGITKDSKAELEYQETQAKAMTMKKVLI
jgi:isochorismate synthase